MTDRKTIATLLKDARFQSGLTLEELSVTSGVSVKNLMSLEKGSVENFYSVDSCRKMAFAYAEALHVDQQIEQLWSDADWMPNSDMLGAYPLGADSRTPALFPTKAGRRKINLPPRLYAGGLIALYTLVIAAAFWRLNDPDPLSEDLAAIMGSQNPQELSHKPGEPVSVKERPERLSVSPEAPNRAVVQVPSDSAVIKQLSEQKLALEQALAVEKSIREKLAAEKAALEKQQTDDKAAREKLAAEKAALEKQLIAETAAREKLAAESAAREKFLKADRSAAQQTAATQATQATPAASAALRAAVETRLAEFASLWSARNVEPYLALFDRSFPNFTRYADIRRKRMLSASFIEVKLSDITYKETAPGEITVRFTQLYRSDNFQSKEIKELVWRQTPTGPRIVLERKLR